MSDAFAGSFWWLDELGQLARRGQPVVIHQTLSGSNYGLIDEDSLEPNPDYFASLLWRRLMGTTVLDVSAVDDPEVAGPPRVRAYAQCTPAAAPSHQPGAMTLLLLNLDQVSAVQVSLNGLGGGDDAGAQVYVVTAAALTSRVVDLNGAALTVAADGTPSSLEATSLAGGLGDLSIPPASCAFVVLPSAQAAGCL